MSLSAAITDTSMPVECGFGSGGQPPEDDVTDVTARYFASWGGPKHACRPERNLCVAMLIQTAQDISGVNRSRNWETLRNGAIDWCSNPFSGHLTLASCIEVLFPQIPESEYGKFGQHFIARAARIALLEFPNSNLQTAKDRSPPTFMQDVFGYQQRGAAEKSTSRRKKIEI